MTTKLVRVLTAVVGLALAAGNAAAQISEMEATGSQGPQYPSLKIGGFSDLNFFASDRGTGITSGFNEGQFVLHFTSQLGPRLGFFSELSATARTADFNWTVERAFVRWDQNDYLKISVGRYHTPINWWNTAFHHGQWLQTTCFRPEMTKFGGKFIPVHFVGALLEGTAPTGGVNLSYKAGVGNGRSSSVAGAGDAGDSNNGRALLLNLFARPDALPHLEAGGAYYDDRITLPDRRDFDEKIVSAYAVWQREDPEVIAEWARVEHDEWAPTGESWSNDAWYVQAAYRLPFAGARLKPYARYEELDIDEGGGRIDPSFSDLKDLERLTAGVRYDFADYLAIKLEYRDEQLKGDKKVESAFLQVSYAF